MRLPGTCQGCHQIVIWNGKRWRDPGQWGRQHHCKVRCGAFMPLAQERCARRPHEGSDHRSRYALDNATRARTGRAA